MTTLGEAFVPIRATMDKLDQDLAGARGKIQGAMSGAFGAVQTIGKTALAGIGVGLLAVGAAGLAVGSNVLHMADDFKDATNAIVVGTGASGEALAEMNNIAKNLAGTSAGLDVEFDTLGATIAEVNTRTGLTGESLEDLSSRILNASRLTGGDAVKNTQLLTRVMGDWSMSNDQASGTLDTLFAAGQATGIGLERLQELIVGYGVPLRNFGFSFEESAALLGKWEMEGVNLELVMGSLRQATMRFASEGIDLQEGLAGASEAIKNAGTASEATAIAMEIFGARAGADMAATIRDGRFEIEDLVAVLENSEGALADATDRTLNFTDKWDLAKRRVMLALMPIGETILSLADGIMPRIEAVLNNAIIPAIETVTSVLRSFFGNLEEGMSPLNAFIEAIWDLAPPAFLDFLVDLRDNILPGLIAKITEVLDPVIDWIKNNVELSDVLVVLGIAIATVIVPAVVSLLAPILAVIAVGAALIAAVSLIRQAWETDWGGIRTFLTSVWENVLQPIFGALWQWLGEYIPWVVQENMQVWKRNWEIIQSVIAVVWPVIESIFVSIRDWITGTLVPTIQELYRVWVEDVWPTIQTVTENVFTAIDEIFTELGRWINDNIVPWVEFFADVWREKFEDAQAALFGVWSVIRPIWESLQEWMKQTLPEALAFLRGAWEGAMGALSGPVESIKGIWQGFVDAVQKFWNWITSHTFSFNISLPDLPAWAIPGSPLPIHDAWKGFAQDMNRMTVRPKFDLPGLSMAGMGGGDAGGAALQINVDARGAVDPAAVERAAERGVKAGLAASGQRADIRIRTG